MKKNPSLVILVILLLSNTSCFKVGEDDPAISFKTRTDRLLGNWTLTEMERTETRRSRSNSSSEIRTWKFDGSDILETSNNRTEFYPYSLQLSFSKDNSFEQFELDNGDETIVKGGWFWAGKSDALDLRKKESVVLTGLIYKNSDGEVDNYQGIGVYPDATLVLKELRKDKMVVSWDWENTESDGYYFKEERLMVFER